MELTQLTAIYARHREILIDVYHDALLEMHPTKLIQRCISLSNNTLRIADLEIILARNESIYVIGSGKASGMLALALQEVLGNRICDGVVVVPRGFKKECKQIQFFEADHPLPTYASLASSYELINFIQKIPAQAIVINLISGGTSSLLHIPPDEVELESVAVVYELLLESGATIEEMNVVRKQLSEINGGRLLPFLKNTRLIDIILSDVPSNNPATIGSGPTTVDESTITDALSVLQKFDLIKSLPSDVTDYFFEAVQTGKTTKPILGSDALLYHHQILLGTSSDLASIICEKAALKGFETHFSPKAYSASARTTAIEIARKAIDFLRNPDKKRASILFVYHGESYIHVTGTGKGGRNQELALTAAISIEGQHRISILSVGTDGKDGPTDAAGAMVNGLTTLRARKKGLEPELYLKNNDSYTFFKQSGDLVQSEKHITNLMDIQIVLVEA